MGESPPLSLSCREQAQPIPLVGVNPQGVLGPAQAAGRWPAHAAVPARRGLYFTRSRWRWALGTVLRAARPGW